MLTRCATLLLLILAGACAQGQSGPTQFRYKLHIGDHLVYRETFVREVKSGDISSRSRTVFENHVLVTKATGQGFVVGVQRNRQSAELLEYRRGGKDVRSKEEATFREQLATRPSRFADANAYAPEGFARLPVQAVRESTSKLLYMAGELAALPTAAVQLGSEWDEPQYSLRFRLTAYDARSCAKIEDVSTHSPLHMKFTFCPATGVITTLELEGSYPGFGKVRYNEKAAFELLEYRRNETVVDWLTNVDTQQAALTAFLLSGSELPDARAVMDLIETATPEVQALALAALWRHGQAPPAAVLRTLQKSNNSEVRRIADRFAAPQNENGKPSTCNFKLPTRTAQKPGTNLAVMESAPQAPYLVHVPIDYRGTEPFPLIVYLSGGDGYAFDGALSAEPVIAHSGYIAVYPQSMGGLWWDSQPTRIFSALLKDVQKAYNIDTNRVYLTGFSNGGSATVYYGILWPQRFAALSSLMGSGFQVPSVPEPLPMKNIANVPLLLVHGDQDPVIPSEQSRIVFDSVRRTHPRVQPELHILKNREHDITLQRDDGYTLPFLERFRREPFPRQLSARILNTAYAGRHYWVEVVEKKGSDAEVEARITDGNVIEVKTRDVKRLKLLLRPELFSSKEPIRVVVNGKERYAGNMEQDCSLFTQTAEIYADPLLAYTDEIVIDLTK